MITFIHCNVLHLRRPIKCLREIPRRDLHSELGCFKDEAECLMILRIQSNKHMCSCDESSNKGKYSSSESQENWWYSLLAAFLDVWSSTSTLCTLSVILIIFDVNNLMTSVCPMCVWFECEWCVARTVLYVLHGYSGEPRLAKFFIKLDCGELWSEYVLNVRLTSRSPGVLSVPSRCLERGMSWLDALHQYSHCAMIGNTVGLKDVHQGINANGENL